ncbi:cell division protein ZapA [Tepidibacillus infernus]|uniref:Cell division protein ZapA n=1 Tax=Tepidibacillus decaturensis TaxID=1413211 RepID=A0A135L1M5_9BACI|nr:MULTISPECIES: cell division protein ZapA [Tepidibacillus]KXG42911.1 Z ring-associated protein [Tepidibacillus decaturensis]GBF12437.1 cell division protein ZapA [Tepidibacillus sp. HK-1]
MNEEQKNRLPVMIYGQQYKIVGKASSNYMRMVAGYVDERMKQIADSNPRLDTTKIAVLTAVNIADEYFRLKQEYDELLKLIEEEE